MNDTENLMKKRKKDQAKIDSDKQIINDEIARLTKERDDLVSKSGGESLTQKLLEDR